MELIEIALIIAIVTLFILVFVMGYCHGIKRVLKRITGHIVPHTNKIYEAVEHEDSKLTNLKKAEIRSFALGRMQATEELEPVLRVPFYKPKRRVENELESTEE